MVQLNKLVFHVPYHIDIIRRGRQEHCCFPAFIQARRQKTLLI